MKTIEIEIQEANIINNHVLTSYTISDGRTFTDITNVVIDNQSLIKHIVDNEMNEYCIDAILGDYGYRNPTNYLEENLSYVVQSYIEETQKEYANL